MISRRQTEITTYKEHFHHAQRGIAKYCLHTAYKAGQPCLAPPAAPLRLLVSTPFDHLLFKSTATQN